MAAGETAHSHKEPMNQAPAETLGVTQAMSPHVGNFVQDLVEMAKAVERVPELEAELARTQGQRDIALDHNQALESNIIGYKSQIETLNERVRSLEVERDDASFRVLEAEDTANAVLVKARAMQTALEGMIEKLDPPKPEPEKSAELQAQPVPTESIQSVTDPTFSEPDWKQDQAETSRLPQKEAPKSDINPSDTSSMVSGDGSTQLAIGSDQPYLGKKYHFEPSYLSLHEWLRGGGTEENYHWRPSYSITTP